MDSVSGTNAGGESADGEFRDRLISGLRDTVIETMTNMAWAGVEYKGIEEQKAFEINHEVSGLVRLSGEHEGLVGVGGSRALMAEVIARIVGLPSADLEEEDLLDGAAELANILCGGMKARAQIGTVDLSPPVSIVGSQYVANWKSAHRTRLLTFEIESGTLYVHTSL